MQSHEVEFLWPLAQEFSSPFQHVAMGSSVKAKTADAMLLRDVGGNGAE